MAAMLLVLVGALQNVDGPAAAAAAPTARAHPSFCSRQRLASYMIRAAATVV